eukprot:753955-Hanusia_phi.AAC.3
MMMIKEIYLENNFLSALPDAIGNLFNLYELRLMNNKIVSIEVNPHSFLKDSSGLASIDSRMSDQSSTALPPAEQFDDFTRVVLLDSNPLVEIPPEVGFLTKLRELSLENVTTLQSPPQSVRNRGLQAIQKYLSAFCAAKDTLELSLSNFNLDSMSCPKYHLLTSLIFEIHRPVTKSLQQTVTLSMPGNRLAYLGLGGLKILRRLVSAGNIVTTISANIGHCSALSELNMSSNRLSALPTEIFELRNLETLDVSQNKLFELPSNIGKCSCLKKLNIERNKIEVLNREIGALEGILSKDLEGISFQCLRS